MNLANKQPSTLKREETGKAEIERFEKEILELKGEKREERMRTYRKLLSSAARSTRLFHEIIAEEYQVS